MENQYTHKNLRWHVDFMLRACCRGVGEVRDEENYWKHHTYLQSHLHCKPSAREEGEWEMEEVGSKLHLFGCQQKDLEKFHKVG
jgi:hypothetical protein